MFHESGDGADLRPYVSSATNGVNPLWHMEPGSAAVNRTSGVISKVHTDQFHRMFSTKRFGGPGKKVTISYRARATAIRDRVGSSIIEGVKIGMRFPNPDGSYSMDDPRSAYGTGDGTTSPGSYQFVTGLTERGYMEFARNGYGSSGYKFFPNKAVGYTPGTWKDVVVTVEWLADRSVRVQYWHNADASGTPIYTATDADSPFWEESGFLWLRADDSDFEYDRITIQQASLTAPAPTAPAPTETAAPAPVPTETAAPAPAPTETAAPAPAPTETAAPAPAPTETAAPAPAPTTPAPSDPAPVDAGTSVTHVSDTRFRTVTNGWGPVERDRSNGTGAAGDGRALTIAGKRYLKGLGTHAVSEVRVPVGDAHTFTTLVGIDDVTSGRGSVVFQVWHGTRKLADSGVVRGSQQPKRLAVDVRGRSEIRLVVTNAGDGSYQDHADWVDAHLLSEAAVLSTAPYQLAQDGKNLVYTSTFTADASSEMYLPLRKVNRLTAVVAVAAGHTAAGAAVFEVWDGSTKLASSGVLRIGESPRSITVDVRGRAGVRLVTRPVAG